MNENYNPPMSKEVLEAIDEAFKRLEAMSDEEFDAIPVDEEWQEVLDEAFAAGFRPGGPSNYYERKPAPDDVELPMLHDTERDGATAPLIAPEPSFAQSPTA